MTKDTQAHIGHLAGLIYRRLEREGKPASAMGLASKLRLWPWDVFLALGWLSREDKVRLRRRLVALMVELKK